MGSQVQNTANRKWKMKYNFRINIIIWWAMIAGCTNKQAALPYYNTPDFTPNWNIEETTKDHVIEPFNFIDQYNNPISEKHFQDKIYIANFFFTSCSSVCPMITEHIQIVADEFKTNELIKFISFSVTPETDSVPRLFEFAAQHDINYNQWVLVTGNKDEIYKLARTSYFADDQAGLTKDASEFLHTEHVLLIDQDKHIRGVYNGTIQLDMSRMIDDIHILLAE